MIMMSLHYWTHANSPDPTDGSKWRLNSYRLLALEVFVRDCQRRRNSSGKDPNMVSFMFYFYWTQVRLLYCPVTHLVGIVVRTTLKTVKVVTNICQSCYLYFLENQTKLRFDQDFVACWSSYFCCCTNCWTEYNASCVFGFDNNFLCNSQLVPKVVFCFRRLARLCDYKTEVWTKIVNFHLNIQPMSSTRCLSLLCL